MYISLSLYMYIHIYIYIYTHMKVDYETRLSYENTKTYAFLVFGSSGMLCFDGVGFENNSLLTLTN